MHIKSDELPTFLGVSSIVNKTPESNSENNYVAQAGVFVKSSEGISLRTAI